MSAMCYEFCSASNDTAAATVHLHNLTWLNWQNGNNPFQNQHCLD